jgi:ActR/RegA family two-component response regulator
VSPFAQADLHSLLLCSDDKVVRVLRRVLTDLEIEIEHCNTLDAAIHKLTRQRFESIIIDCASEDLVAKALKGTNSSPANKRAIRVAIVDGHIAARAAFSNGAHFVLLKPISLEMTKASFRSVRALMKRERRRHARIPVQLPVKLYLERAARTLDVVTADLSENGIAIKSKVQLPPSFGLHFELPGTSAEIDCRGEVAWEGNRLQGIRFRELAADSAARLKTWIARQLMGADAEDPPVTCRLTDLSLGACYLDTESPFPVRTRLQIGMKVGDLELKTEGIVRVMHPGAGMGVQFTDQSPDGRKRLEDFIHTLVTSEGALPDVEIQPDSIDNSPAAFSDLAESGDHDPLLSLFHAGAELAAEEFKTELRKQRGATEEIGM